MTKLAMPDAKSRGAQITPSARGGGGGSGGDRRRRRHKVANRVDRLQMMILTLFPITNSFLVYKFHS
jgi:hypothetical protein